MTIKRMDRMFLPVGQGAFYCERFKSPDSGRTMNFVYDCGVLLKDRGNSKVKLQRLENVIDTVFRNGETINAIFISHLHEDHINGLQHLAKRCSIKKIYLPLLDDESRQLMLLNHLTENFKSADSVDARMRDFTGKILASKTEKDFRELLNNDTEVIFIPTLRESNEDAKDRVSNEEAKGLELRDSALFTEEVEGPFSNWKYKLFCIKDDDAVSKVRTGVLALVKRFLKKDEKQVSAETVAELAGEICKMDKKQYKAVVDEIYNVYVGAIGRLHFNTHSLVVYSGCDNLNDTLKVRATNQLPAAGTIWSYLRLSLYRYRYRLPSYSNKVSCLYTGDFNAKDYWSELHDSYFQREWNTIGCVQIPHHGSEESYNGNFLRKKKAWHVISAGLGNRYSHPSPEVLVKYLYKGVYPIVVSQDPRSYASFTISW